MQKLANVPENKRVYLDESGINKYLYRQYGRGLRGEKVFGEISGNRFGRQSIISAILNGKFLSKNDIFGRRVQSK